MWRRKAIITLFLFVYMYNCIMYVINLFKPSIHYNYDKVLRHQHYRHHLRPLATSIYFCFKSVFWFSFSKFDLGFLYFFIWVRFWHQFWLDLVFVLKTLRGFHIFRFGFLKSICVLNYVWFCSFVFLDLKIYY